MKKLYIMFLLVVLVIGSTNIFAGTFYLSLYDDSEFYVTFNGSALNTPVKFAEFNINSNGKHHLKIAKYDISSPKGSYIIFEGYVSIPNGYNVYSVIDEGNNFVVYKKVKEQFTYNNDCNCFCDACRNCTGKHTDDLSNNEWGYDCGTIGGRDFSELKKLIADKSFESTKLDIAKSEIDMNYFKSEQVKEMLQLFTFESSKVELAKYAYSKTCDKNTYYKIYDVFTFESSVSDVEKYIKGQK